MANEISRAQAIESLMPTADWTLLGDTELLWTDSEQTEPTASAITTEQTRLQAIYDNKEYQRLRKAKYNLLNQDEMRYDDVKNSTTTWVDAINAIKAAHPKP
jgi:hypothetical protein